MNEPKHPMQHICFDSNDELRFVPNRIVRFLLDAGPFDMYQLEGMVFEDEDREQFAQLIGYSVRGFGELSYTSDEAYEKAMKMVEECDG